jgi:hypothetical protein
LLSHFDNIDHFVPETEPSITIERYQSFEKYTETQVPAGHAPSALEAHTTCTRRRRSSTAALKLFELVPSLT